MTETPSLTSPLRHSAAPLAAHRAFAEVAAWRATEPTASPPRVCLPAESLAGVLDDLDTGVLVCDANGQVLLFNEAARRELADGGVLQIEADGALSVPGSASLLQLRRAVHGAAWERRHQLVPLRSGQHTLMVAVQPLRAAPASQPCAVLLLGRRCLGADLTVQRLGGLYDLTEAEKAVLTSLLAGTRVTALARLRGVAVSTVRTQVAALRAKFGVRRIDDLTRLVAELPPMMSALRRSVGAAQR